ncbi:MAG: antibiotic biosynthesis monooxygenase [Maricaulaceae bacterium]
MIVRHWRGWTTPSHETAYQDVLQNRIMPGIMAREIKGLRGFHLTKRPIVGPDGEPEIEFCTIMWWDHIQAIKDFVGEDFEVSHVPQIARAVLKRFDDRVVHYEVFQTTDRVGSGPHLASD